MGEIKNSLSIRMNGHRSSSKNPDILPLPVSSTSNHANSVLLEYKCTSWSTPVLITAANLNFLINSFCHLHTILVLTSYNSRSAFPPSLPILSLVAITRNCHVAQTVLFVHIHLFSLIENDLCECPNISVKFPGALLVYLCLSSGDLHFR